MPNILPVQTPTKPVLPDPQKPPPSNTPGLNIPRQRLGIKPGTPTYPTRINPPLKVPAAPVGAAGAGAGAGAAGAAGAAAGGGGIGILLPALALAIPQVLLLDSPAAAPELMPAEPPQPVEPPNIPFNGGQSSALLYDVTYELNTPTGIVVETGRYYGPIASAYFQRLGDNTVYYLISGGYYFYGYHPNLRTDQIVNYFYLNKPSIKITNIKRVDGKPDVGGNPPPTNTPIYSNPGNSIGTPQPQSPTLAPPPLTRQPQLQQRTPTPAPAPAPTQTNQPQPIGQPQPLPFQEFQPLPFAEEAPRLGLNLAPPPVAEPTPAPVPTPTLNTNRSPTPFIPSAPFPPTILITPGGNPVPLIFTPNPATGNPEPKAPPITSPIRSPDPEPTDLDKFRDTVNKLLIPIGIGVTGITALLNPVPGKLDQIKNQTDPNTLKEISKSATCETFQPGGCAAGLPEDARNAANNSASNATALSAITAFMQALSTAFLQPILAGVNLINTKLGPLMAGADGIGGFLKRAYEATHIDKALNAMNTVLLVHNAAMLSRNLGSTLGDLTSQALSIIGIKDAEGSPIDINKEIGTQVNSFMENLVGAEVWRGTKTSWNKASSIISSATNIMYTVRSMFDSGREILEWTAENTGKIGNALKKYRIVGEDAYKWMPERVTVQNAFTRRIDRIREGTDNLDDAASSLTGVLGEVQSIQQEYADLQEQKQRFDANIKDLTPKLREENKPVADAVTTARTASKAPTDMPTVFRGEGESSDA